MAAQILPTNTLPGRTLLSGTREYLYFGGTSYLGMASNKSLQSLLRQAIKQYGLNYGSSRLSNVQLSVYEQAESFLANYTGAAAALTISSGLLAGQLVVQTLAPGHTCFYSPDTHPALWLKSQMPTCKPFTEWAKDLPNQIAQSKAKNILIMGNSLDPLHAQKYDWGWLQQLKTTKNITVVLDDSHGLGITGPNGAGIYRELALPPTARLIVVSSLGKALGIPGGVILADYATIARIKNSPFFGSASPVVPAYLAAFLRATRVYAVARKQLAQNIAYFNSRLQTPGLFQSFSGYPVFFTWHHKLYPYLLAHNVLISSFPYPTPQSQPITRIILNSLHTTADLNKLTQLINQFGAESLAEEPATGDI